MSLTPGTQIGPYKIVTLLRVGGMGEIYRAIDPRIGREVAVKIINDTLSTEPEILGRFEQETRAAGALNHPNILSIYDVGTAAETPYLVSELLDGETLGDRLRSSALPIAKAIDYGVQIAQGLAAAHEKGIIHRDMKPDNIFITKDGRVKILDFGLAKLTNPEIANVRQSGISTPMGTRTGMVLGTPAYMSPEQVRGEKADQRSDIFSFGAILYEMLAGKSPFEGDTAVERMNSILKEDPAPIQNANRPVSTVLEKTVRRCLEKRPDLRFESARDLGFHLQALSDSATGSVAPLPATPSFTRSWVFSWPIYVVCGLVLGLLPLLFVKKNIAQEVPVFQYLTYSGYDDAPAVSPDGRTIAFSSNRDGHFRIWLKQLVGGSELPITAGEDRRPRFSWDGSMILYAHADKSGSSIYRVPALGGDPRKVIDNAVSGDWSPDGRRIAFVRWKTKEVHDTYISIIGLADWDGSGVREIASFEGQADFPRWSVDGKRIAVTKVSTSQEKSCVLLFDLDGKQTVAAWEGGYGSSIAWGSTGKQLIYAQTEGNPAVPGASRVLMTDLQSGQTRTIFASLDTITVLDIVAANRLVFDAKSRRQHLFEVRFKDNNNIAETTWLTRGNSVDRQPAYSPNGEWIIFSSNRGGNLDLWEISTKSGTVRKVTDHAASDWDPAFSGDGKRIIWSSDRTGHFEIWSADLDGSDVRQLTNDGGGAENPACSPDGRLIVYYSFNPSKRGLWKMDADGSHPTRMMGGTAGYPQISPDGRYVIYVAPGTSKYAVHVLELATGKVLPFQISTKQLVNPRPQWTPDGRSIALIDLNEQGLPAIYVQDFVPGKDTADTRRSLMNVADYKPETFSFSPDGAHLVVSDAEASLSSLMLVDHVTGISPPAKRLP